MVSLEMTSYVSVFSSLVRQWMHISVSLQRPGLRLQKTGEFRSCSSSLDIDIFFVLRRLITMVQTFQQIIEIPQSFVFGGRCPRYAGHAVSQVPPWRRHSCSHSCSSLRIYRPCFRLRKTAGLPRSSSRSFTLLSWCRGRSP